jgi:molybdate transport system substrate-binding protein
VKKITGLSIIFLLVATLFASLSGCTAKQSVTLNVSAAASLTDALKEINDLYTKENSNVTITPNFASSGTLLTQIQSGAPADVFISAGAKQMNTLQNAGLIVDDTRQELLKNKVVLVVPNNSTLNISDFNALLNDSVKKIAIGDPASVPAGDYGKQALQTLGIYDKVQSKLILCTDVRQVLSYVESGDVDAGIVYATDAAISSTAKVMANAPDEVNAKIVYPVAAIKASTVLDAAKDYIKFLSSNKAKAIFEKYGFTMVK